MNIDASLKKLKSVMEEYPAGAVVWHRADGSRGIVVEHCIDGSSCIMLNVAFGIGDNWTKCLPCELSGAPIRESGDEWKDGKEGAGA